MTLYNRRIASLQPFIEFALGSDDNRLNRPERIIEIET
jgi:hypothetical protein